MSLLATVRGMYVGRKTGLVDVDDTTLLFREGRLYVSRESPAAAAIAAAQRAEEEREASLRRALEALAAALAGRRGRRREVAADLEAPLGPLPGGWFLMALALHGCGGRELRARLGGDRATAAARLDGPALEELSGLPPRMSSLLGRLDRPTPIGQLAGGSDAEHTLRDLVALHAVGLLSIRGPEAGATDETERVLARFRRSVATHLELDPVTLDPDAHRARIAETWRLQGEADHYTLLGLDHGADGEAVHRGFTALARLVHPDQAQRLGLAADDAMLAVLFERAVEAYRTLTDPDRRLAYHRRLGRAPTQEIDARQREDEKRAMAGELYRRGVSYLAANEISPAVDALREAVRLEPRADYLGALGRAQSHNRGWHRHARESFRRAIALAPSDAGLQVGLGALYEKMGRENEAAEAYRKAVALMPDNAEAKRALERLGVSPRASATFGVRGLFRRDRNSGD